MNIAMICRILGLTLGVEAAFMVPALAMALVRGESGAAFGFGAAIALTLLLAALSRCVRVKRREYYAREGFVTVGLSWILLSALGALPFYLSGAVPSYIDAFFETVSGFTTTGASILPDVEALPKSLLYWRSFTVWLGGMGVLVFVLAISPMSAGDSGDTLHLLRAESPGVNVGKLVPRMRRSTSILYLIYIGMTVLMFVMLVFDMPVFDALTTAFATAGTGGFSIRNAGMGVYSTYSQTVITVFMILFSINFTLYYLVLIGRVRQALRSEELWGFLGILFLASLAIAVNILPIFGSFGASFHQAIFTAASMMSTAGFAISDFNLWPWFSQTVLILLMFVGACAGSTGGGIKIVRILIAAKLARRGIQRAIHPQQIRCLHMDGEALDEDTCQSVSAFLLVYVLLFAALVLLLALDGLDFVTTFSAAASCFNNVGPGLGLAGPMSNYGCFSPFGKLLLSFAMLFGRLELYPMLFLFIPSVWRK